MRRRRDHIIPFAAAAAVLSLALEPTRAQDAELGAAADLDAVAAGVDGMPVATASTAPSGADTSPGASMPSADAVAIDDVPSPTTRATVGDAEPASGDALRALLGPELLALGAVVLEDRLPLASWSDVTDSWPLEPARQRRRMPRRCRTRGGYRAHCSGERLVPEPTGVAAALAEYFGLGQRGTAMVLMHEPAYPEWLALVAASDPDARLDWPVPGGHRGRGFGHTRTGELSHRRHQGIDIGAPEGTPIRAARGGLVVYSDNYITGYGNMVIVLHADGFSTFYAHCRQTVVAAGQYVARGEILGEVGETGFAGAPHLHFEWRHAGRARDPMRRFLRETMRAESASIVSAEPASDPVDLQTLPGT